MIRSHISQLVVAFYAPKIGHLFCEEATLACVFHYLRSRIDERADSGAIKTLDVGHGPTVWALRSRHLPFYFIDYCL